MNKEFYFSQFIIGVGDSVIAFMALMNIFNGRYVLSSIGAIPIWLLFRWLGHTFGLYPYPWDSEDWNKESETTICPHCSGEIIDVGNEYRCENYPKCLYIGKGVYDDE